MVTIGVNATTVADLPSRSSFRPNPVWRRPPAQSIAGVVRIQTESLLRGELPDRHAQ
jgi:hypothetical protein